MASPEIPLPTSKIITKEDNLFEGRESIVPIKNLMPEMEAAHQDTATEELIK